MTKNMKTKAAAAIVWLFVFGAARIQSWSFPVAPSTAKRTAIDNKNVFSRRQALNECGLVFLISFVQTKACHAAAAPKPSLEQSLSLIQQAREQLSTVPDLIKKEQWDSVRAILITPPLSDCWAKSSGPLLKLYAEVLGDSGGDEFAALEAREEVISRLRYLDMAVYNNVFNPIKTEGENGATPELIRSYYEDPINEWKASVAALDELIQLSK